MRIAMAWVVVALGLAASPACIPAELTAGSGSGGSGAGEATSSASSSGGTTTTGSASSGGGSSSTGGEGGTGGAGGATSSSSSGGGGSGGAGGAGPSCEGLDAICGPDGDADCCAADLIPGGRFDRSNDPTFPATVSPFRLDRYEISVGRFRAFIDAYRRNMIPDGAGTNPNQPLDPGWDPFWNGFLPANADALAEAVACEGSTAPGGQRNPEDSDPLPINCITWYEAFAFCIWDGGRLPTEAEWNFAAAGGDEQRAYPWSADHDQTIDDGHAVYGNEGDGPAAVGSRSPLGDGRWGHADLAGNLREWVRDNHAAYLLGCDDCLSEGSGQIRVRRDGSFADEADDLLTSVRYSESASTRVAELGARCARAP